MIDTVSTTWLWPVFSGARLRDHSDVVDTRIFLVCLIDFGRLSLTSLFSSLTTLQVELVL